MPWGDGTGPWRGRGGSGGRGWFCLGGYGRGWRNWYNATGMPGWFRADAGAQPPFPFRQEGEEKYLESQANFLEAQLDDIRARLKDLGKE